MGIATMRVPTVFTAVDRFSDVVSRMTRKTAAFGETAQAASMRTSRRLNESGTAMLGAGIGLATGLGYAVNEAVKFEKAMANVDTTIDSLPGQIEAMGHSVLEMSKKIPVPISQLTDALYDVVSAGIASKDSMMVLKSSAKLGVAGLGTAKEGVDIITSSLNAFNIKATESEKVANMVFKAVKYGKTTVSGIAESFGSSAALVKNSNVSLEEYLATTATLTTTGMTASRAQTQVSSAVTALIKPSGTMSKIFANLGVKDVPRWIKANGGLVNSMRIVRDEADRMGVLTSKAFGRKEGFSAMLSLLGPLADKFNTVYGDMTANINAMDSAFEKQKKTVSSSVQIMKNKLTVLAIAIGEEVLPRINGFIGKISGMSESVLGFVKRNEGFVTLILNATVALLSFGIVAKVGAALFYGYSKAIMVVSAVIKAYTFISTLAALANVSFATALWGVATALWAAYWPVLLVVAALGGLAYALSDTGKTAESSAQKQLNALTKQNNAYKNSTTVVADELQKQKDIISKHNATPLAKGIEKPKNTAEQKYNKIIHDLENTVAMENYRKQRDSLMVQKNLASTELYNRTHNIHDYGQYNKTFLNDQLKAQGLTYLQDKGMSFNEIEKIYPKLTTIEERKQELEITIKTADGNYVETKMDGNTYGPGIPIIVSSTKIPRQLKGNN